MLPPNRSDLICRLVAVSWGLGFELLFSIEMWWVSGVLLSSKIVRMRGSGRKSTESSTKKELMSVF